eukprot:CAMPEP_0194077598 /NCGR_PEP_ID=MMETSP0149-20130528/4197_1 /TAXON_ID=122233 /ORGANISM="Chaetoceros debilis, Strain MM31A-1" /LENGTH=383 /DNA_ID=CAMNT_0038758667 /DNA_START=260 /DNA_END=1411 /DNA_ORIENTATION=+
MIASNANENETPSLRPPIVTPSSTVLPSSEETSASSSTYVKKPSKARRQLTLPSVGESEEDTSSSSSDSDPEIETILSKISNDKVGSPSKRSRSRNYFGRYQQTDTDVTILPKTRTVYKLVNKMTGSIGGNGRGGAIYGELTMGSMQKMINLMKEHTNFNSSSRFIDVGCGLGKPNIHVAQDPQVEFSYGIEMEHVRWVLGMSNLKVSLKEACRQEAEGQTEEECIRHRCMLAHGDITEAQFFDPFTHVYMFDIGFPPKLFKQLGKMFNRSQSEYLICYHRPSLMVDRYGFNVELIIQEPTSMHGSSEGHMGYIYRRVGRKQKIGKGLQSVDGVPCDPLFKDAWLSTKKNVVPLYREVERVVKDNLNSQRPSRQRQAPTRYGE